LGVRSTIVVFGSARVLEDSPEPQGRWYREARSFGRIVSERGGLRGERRAARQRDRNRRLSRADGGREPRPAGRPGRRRSASTSGCRASSSRAMRKMHLAMRECARRVADAAYVFKLNGHDDPVAAAPLMCAGLDRLAFAARRREAERIGLHGFGAAAHIIAQVCRWQGRQVYAFTRPGDTAAQAFAQLAAVWAGGSDDKPPERVDAAILFAPIGALVPTALARVCARAAAWSAGAST
jgi:hypothetical protein